jgi:Caspase domain
MTQPSALRCGHSGTQRKASASQTILAASMSRVLEIAATALLIIATWASVPVANSQTNDRGVKDLTASSANAITSNPYYALIIGNDNYQHINKLKTATNDARAVEELLRRQYGFTTILLEDATREKILTALADYRRQLPPNSNLLIYYAGHGYRDPQTNEAYWLPVDAQGDGNSANWISADDITAAVRAIQSFHVLIISDSCYSGTLTRDSNVGRAPLEEMYKRKSRTLLASGGNEPVADGGGGSHSIFAAVLLGVFQEMKDGDFNAEQMLGKIQERVTGQSQQLPQYFSINYSGHDGGDFVFFVPGGRSKIPDCCKTMAGLDDTSDRIPAPGGGSDVLAVVDKYRRAYEAGDIGLFQQIWPSMPAARVNGLRDFLRAAKLVKLNCSVIGEPEVQTNSATVNFFGQLSYTMNGQFHQAPKQKMIMKLKKATAAGSQSSWEIVSIR